MRAIQNKAFYKVFLKRQTPNIEAIEEHLAAFKKSEDLFLSNYLGNKDLMGGNDVNVCDLIASATFEQVHKYIEHLKLTFVVLSYKRASFHPFLNWHGIGKQEKCSSLGQPRGNFYKA